MVKDESIFVVGVLPTPPGIDQFYYSKEDHKYYIRQDVEWVETTAEAINEKLNIKQIYG